MEQAVTPTPLRTALIAEMPEVENAVIIDNNDAVVQRGDKRFMEDFLLMTDPSFLDIFSFELKSGDKHTALNEPYSIILSESMAARYFGEEDPLGQALTIFHQDPDGKGKAYTVTGVMEDCPSNSHFRYQALMSFRTFEVNHLVDPRGYDWYNNGYYTYVLLREGSDPAQLQSKLPGLVEKYMGQQNREWKISYEYLLQPLTDIHLYSSLRYEIQETSSLSYVVVFATVGVIVLLLACINYVNLATAFSAGRFREVGLRKVMGALRRQLIGQHLTESLLLAVFSLLAALVWIELSRPMFESLTGKLVASLYSLEAAGVLAGIATLVGVAAGMYPALLLTSYQPVGIIKGQLKTGASGALLRKSLVVAQYSETIILVTGILAVNRQLAFIRNHDLGFNRDGLLVLGVNDSQEVITGYEAFASELGARRDVAGVTRSNTALAGGLGNSVAVLQDASGKEVNATVNRVRTDFDFVDTYQMDLVAGRYFREDNAADSTLSFVVNEALSRTYGYSDPALLVGKKFEFQGRKGQVIGVVRDFHYNSLKYRIDPTCLYLLRGSFSQITVRLSGDTRRARQAVEEAWRKHFPNTLLDARFVDESLDNQYQAELRFARLFAIFSSISLAIACIGLFALVSYSVEGRVREIGIRKVLGASSLAILAMFSGEFMRLIGVSAVVAIPAGYVVMNQWLQGFAYRVTLGPGTFMLAGAIVMGIAWLTVSLRSVGAANANPVNSLRND
jgi:putative ABC transport system permease protein